MATHDYPATSSSGPDISGAPNAGEYARFADADTLEARTTAQVLSDIGAPDITGTPVANQMATWSDANTLQASAAELTTAGALSGVTTISHSGAVTMSGTPASAGASVRNQHGNGGATDDYHNVPTGGTYAWTINGVMQSYLNTAGFSLGSGMGVKANTADNADSAAISLSGGGALGSTRGGGVTCYGNEHASTGEVVIEAGNVSGGDVDLKTQALSRIKVNYDGTLTFHATTLADLQSQIGAGETTGAVKMWGTGSAPTGYLLCDGSAVSRSTYSALFAVLGTTFGAGDGSTTFALPDFRGRAPIGAGTGSGLTARTLAGTVGTETHTLTGAESGLPAHTHTIPGANGGSGSTRPGFADGGALYSHNTGSTGPTDASSAHNNMQPSLVVNFIIKT